MKAIQSHQFGLPSQLVLNEIEEPTPKPDEVLIKINAAAVNFPDVLMVQGKYQFRPELSFVSGMELTGRVEALGELVEGFEIGQSVLAFNAYGAFAEKVTVPQHQVFVLPSGVEYKVAAAMLYTYGTSYHALKDRGKLKSGETLLVLGAGGGVGLAAVELGELMNAKVIAAASTDEKLELCRAKGADVLLNYSRINLKEKVKALGGCDVVLDPVGGPISELALRSLNYDGRHLVVGFASGEIPTVRWNLPLLKTASIVGVFWTDFRKRFPQENRRNLETLVQYLGMKEIQPVVQQCYSLEETPKALQDLLERKTKGKSVILLSSE